MKSLFIWKNYLSFYLLVLTLVNISLINFPLTGVFGYEFSVINSMVIVLLAGIYTINFYDASFQKKNFHFTSELFESLSILLVIPFLVSVINSFITGFCSFIDGLLFYLVLTVPSIVIGTALGLLSVYISKRFRGLWLFLFYVGILFIILLEIYFNPQVYVYNPIIGFFPGTIYDEGISVTWKLFIYRLFNIIFFSYIIKSVLVIKRKKGGSRKFIRVVLALIFLVGFYLLSPMLGFSTTKSHLENELSSKLESDHFIIHYDRRISDNKLKYLAVSQEYYYDQLKEFFQLELKKRINTYVFYDDDQKKELFGSRNADVAKPWLNQIYISYQNWEHTLKHEMAHCFSGVFGSGIFRLASGLNPMLIEGIAEAADGLYEENSLHFMTALAYKEGYRADIENLLTKFGFFSSTPSLSYIYAGSFIKYLIQIEGMKKFKQYYVSGEFKGTYGYELSSFTEKYYLFLDDYKGKISTDEANFYFGRKSLFQKVCPRAISEALKKGWEQIREFNFGGAQKTFEAVLRKSDNYSALVGLAKSFEKLDSISNATAVIRSRLEEFKGTSYYYNLELYLADLLLKAGNIKSADSLYSELTEQKPNRTLNYLTNVRKILVKKRLVNKYLNGSDYDKYHIIKSIIKSDSNYWLFPVLITLSKRLEEDYNFFIDELKVNYRVNNYESSYAMLKLSEYMLENFDTGNSKKIAGLSLRYNSDKNFVYVLQEHYNKVDWFFQNGQAILNTFYFSNKN